MKDIITFDEHLDQRYGKIGTERRTDFEIKAKAFAIGEIIREARKEADMTQEELAKRTGTRKSFISRIENGHSDIQLSTEMKPMRSRDRKTIVKPRYCWLYHVVAC